MTALSTPRFFAAIAATSAISAILAALPGIAAGEPDLIWPLMGLGAVIPMAIVLPIAAIVLPLYILLRRPRATATPTPRIRVLGALIGGTVGTLLGVCAASNGHIASLVVLILAICGAILGYADACWREQPQSAPQ